MTSRPQLTLAVIVKNEAELLKSLLQHHKEIYDESVVVDTGSIDHSREVALEAGAQLFEYKWNDDFAAARNHGLENSNGKWILQLDCDERIDPVDFKKILAIIQGEANTCHTLTIHNYTETAQGKDWCAVTETDHPWCENAPGYWQTNPIRLFPNRSQVRYSGVIHENLADDITKLGLPTLHSPVVIHHTGLLDRGGRSRRDKLYGPLLLKKVKESPNDIRGFTELANFMVSRNQLSTAERLMNQGFARIYNADNDIQANLMMVEIQARLGKTDLALNRLETTIKNYPEHLLCWIQAVVLNLLAGNEHKAAIYLKQGRKLFPASPVLKQLEANEG